MPHPPVRAGDRLPHALPGALRPDVDADRDPLRRVPAGGVEDVGRDAGHWAASFRSRMALILPISPAATARSVAGRWPSAGAARRGSRPGRGLRRRSGRRARTWLRRRRSPPAARRIRRGRGRCPTVPAATTRPADRAARRSADGRPWPRPARPARARPRPGQRRRPGRPRPGRGARPRPAAPIRGRRSSRAGRRRPRRPAARSARPARAGRRRPGLALATAPCGLLVARAGCWWPRAGCWWPRPGARWHGAGLTPVPSRDVDIMSEVSAARRPLPSTSPRSRRGRL